MCCDSHFCVRHRPSKATTPPINFKIATKTLFKEITLSSISCGNESHCFPADNLDFSLPRNFNKYNLCSRRQVWPLEELHPKVLPPWLQHVNMVVAPSKYQTELKASSTRLMNTKTHLYNITPVTH